MFVITDANAFSSLLRRVHLSGIIGECVVNIEGGVVNIEALDCTNSVFVHGSAKVAEEGDAVFGIGNMSTLAKFLTGNDSVEIKIQKSKDSEWLTAKRKAYGSVKFLLLDPTEVPTAVQETGVAEKISSGASNSTVILDKAVNGLVDLCGMVGSLTVDLTVKGGLLTVSTAERAPQQFRVPFGKMNKKEDFTVRIYSEHLLPVLKELDFSDDKKPKLFLGENAPVIVKQGGVLWAITPLGE